MCCGFLGLYCFNVLCCSCSLRELPPVLRLQGPVFRLIRRAIGCSGARSNPALLGAFSPQLLSLHGLGFSGSREPFTDLLLPASASAAGGSAFTFDSPANVRTDHKQPSKLGHVQFLLDRVARDLPSLSLLKKAAAAAPELHVSAAEKLAAEAKQFAEALDSNTSSSGSAAAPSLLKWQRIATRDIPAKRVPLSLPDNEETKKTESTTTKKEKR